MKKYKKKYRHNTLLLLSILFFALFLFYGVILSEFYSGYSRSTMNLDRSFLFVSISALLFAPLIEEFIFRGAFINKKWLGIVSLVLGVLFVFFALDNSLSKVLYVLFLITVFVVWMFKKDQHSLLLYIISAISFAYCHYNISDFINLDAIFYSFIHLTSGFLFCWISANFKFLYSVLAHFSWNLITICLVAFALIPNSDDDLIFQNKHFQGTISREFFMSKPKSSSYEIKDDTIKCKNCDPLQLYKIFGNKNKFQENNIEKLPFTWYNINIISDSINFNDDVDNLKFLFDNEILKEKDLID